MNKKDRRLLTLINEYEACDNFNLVVLNNIIIKSVNEEEGLILTILLLMDYDKHRKIDGYYENWLPHYLDSDFFSLFRMSKQTFEELLRRLHCRDKFYTGGQYPVPVEKQLLITLWWLGKGEVLLSAADTFNVVLSTVFHCTEHILERINELKEDYIVWPDNAEVSNIASEFRQRSGYPGIIGAIDSCSVKIKAPLNQQDRRRSQSHSIKLQGIVTCKKIFTNINVGFPGSAHDSRIFRNSSLYEEIEGRGQLQSHLVGNSAYPLCTWLMTPYKDNGNLTNMQRRHNRKLSQTRVVVEHAFGILKSRWRMLHYINVNSIYKMVKIIAACCALHNFCYLKLDFWNDCVPENYNEEDYVGDNAAIAAINQRFRIARSFDL